MHDAVTPELIEEITNEMIAQAKEAGAQQSLDTFVTSYRKLTNLKRLRADIEEYRLSVYKFLNAEKQITYVNANIKAEITNYPIKKYFGLASMEQEVVIYWIKTQVLDKPKITLKEILNAWLKEILVPTNWKHYLKYYFSQKYRLQVKADSISVLSFNFRSKAMADYILTLRAVCRQSREEIIHAFVGRGVVIPGNVNAHLTLRDCISNLYLEQKAMAQVAIKHHKQVLEGINRKANEPIPEHVAEEFPEDNLYPKPEYIRNADQEEENGELPEEDESNNEQNDLNQKESL
jgi:hypothetical protein